MGENLTARQKEQLAYLRRLCLAWARFTEVKWDNVYIIIENKDIDILWYQILWLDNPDGTKQKYFNNSLKHFPIKQLGKQIKEYEAKIKREYKIRNLSEDEKANKRASAGVR